MRQMWFNDLLRFFFSWHFCGSACVHSPNEEYVLRYFPFDQAWFLAHASVLYSTQDTCPPTHGDPTVSIFLPYLTVIVVYPVVRDGDAWLRAPFTACSFTPTDCSLSFAAPAAAPHLHPPQYEESLLEMRRVLHACILHAPSSVDAFWAAAAVEGGVSPDPGDMKFSCPGVGTSPRSSAGPRRQTPALSGELVRVLGLADLNLREEDVPLLEDT